MKKGVILLLIIANVTFSFGQDSIPSMEKDTTQLDEVILITQRKLSNYRQEKTLSSIDDYLEKSNRVTMIKRGSYAWEPSLNNMTSERLNVTIDGMYIFGACTDKMDPVTSYVDVSNLKQVVISSGQEGTENGHCIGGAIDLQLPESKYFDFGLKSNVDLGYETNGNYRIAGLDFEYSANSFYASIDAIYRKSDNYKAGGDEEVMYSQFEKYNISGQMGYRLNPNNKLDANIIYDRAANVGYPALPMDVSLAEAFIGSVAHNYQNDSTFVNYWETKLYFNSITHIMDDSQRPDVPIRMDMPGWSDTYGFYSKLGVDKGKHGMLFNLNGFYNRSLAEMTMYPNDVNQPSMFMYTWPDVRTFYTGLFAKDNYVINDNEEVSVSMRLGFHNNEVAEEEGLESLKIFYPEIQDSKSRFLLGLSSEYQIEMKEYDFTVGVGYGERAPSVSEGYGFYLFNSFDRFDYIGNPTLSNEKSLEVNLKTNYYLKHFKVGLESSYFHVLDYIIGEIDSSISPMTIGANGVKIYSAIDHASIFDFYLNTSYHFAEKFLLNASLGYNYGKGSNGENLPLIKPLSYLAEVSYSTENFNVAMQCEGNGNQSKYSSYYGEDETPAYGIFNLNFGNVVYLKSNKLVLKYGIENILDTNYSTFADWNNISRQGRNFYINMSVVLN
ncbi:TonB-dependent receptor [Mangrovimonas sp. AS39]|uniref:TonB-dependent receptor n=1 Tax=Mangrovimonas futianensis TaxID=2895523 RepID=UPI001E331D9E|nr:TonB-dependent receptor [Mangrovimonas futianensis]MCF1192287.1 TonB-dependent receptor [Mangrovimonas futianensis]MCF1195964.1 TonB-dependent receptor [Mangrovimonas futianensis]MCF1422978.1 TonB-dependent receptor [Mangrovimonas futianensis]